MRKNNKDSNVYNLNKSISNIKKICFLIKKEASYIIEKNRLYFKNFSRFDKESRGFKEKVDTDEISNYYKNQIIPWKDYEIENILESFQIIFRELKNHHYNFPEQINLILTTGLEEGHACYCLKNAIIFSEEKANFNTQDISSLMRHELFHIYSQKNPEVRKRLYNLIGFRLCDPIGFPEQIKDYTITNPDTYDNPCYISLPTGYYYPFLYSPKNFGEPLIDEQYRENWRGPPKKKPTFFDYITFGLLKINLDNNGVPIPILNGKNTQIFDPKDLNEYYDKIKNNTGYIIHPEEIMAENFQLLLSNSKYQIRYKDILEQMNKIMNMEKD